MGLEEIARRIDKLRNGIMPGTSTHDALTEILYAIDADGAGDAEDDPPVSLDDGFVVLPIAKFDELRQAEESLQETRFEPTDGKDDGKQATIDALTRENARIKAVMSSWEVFARIKGDEIARLKADAKVRAEAAAPSRTAEGTGEMSRRVDHLIQKTDYLSNMDGTLLRHIQDIQAEIDGIKARLDEGCGEFNKIKSRLDQIGAVGLHFQTLKSKVDELTPSFDAKLGAHWDRINALVARLNRLEADVMPIRRIGPLREPTLGPEARRKVDEAKERLLEEAGRATGAVESTEP